MFPLLRALKPYDQYGTLPMDSNDITKSKELIVVNIPAYELTFPRWKPN
jgi:hypothetical protein